MFGVDGTPEGIRIIYHMHATVTVVSTLKQQAQAPVSVSVSVSVSISVSVSVSDPPSSMQHKSCTPFFGFFFHKLEHGKGSLVLTQ